MEFRVNIPSARIKLFGLAAAKNIRQRTLAGKDKDGAPFKAYSTNPFAMPAGATTKRALSTLDKKGSILWFTTGSGAKWIIIEGGYKELKAAKRPSHAGKVNLTDTGQMMNDFTVISVRDDSVKLGWNKKENAQKALWNIEMGRDFLGIPESEFEKLSEDILGKDIEVEVVQ